MVDRKDREWKREAGRQTETGRETQTETGISITDKGMAFRA